MKIRLPRLLWLSALLVPALAPLSAQRSDILPPARREPTVEQAIAVANRPVLEPLAANLNNPFYPDSLKPQPDAPPAQADAAAPVRAGPTSNFDLLQTVAPQINPTGTMSLGGRPLLLFGQKKVQIGETLPIIYDGRRYELIITAIEPTQFTLRLGDAELTRPIKLTN